MPRLARLAGVLSVVACASVPGSSSDTPSPDRFEAVRARIRSALAHDSLVSPTVAVTRGGRIVWEEGFGWADREHHVPATPETMYSLASVSKPLTATGAMVLVNRGALQLDAPANRYLGSGKLTAYRGNADSATVRRLLGHMSGLSTHAQFFYADEPYRRPDMDETIRRYGILVTAPGEAFEYSNLGFGILDHIIERLSSTPYEAFMRTEVFLPLGLTHTAVGVDSSVEPRGAAARYDSAHHRIPFYDFDHRGASAIYSSAHDLALFGMFHLKDHVADQRPILPDSLIDEMHPRRSGHRKKAFYAFGWGVHPDDYGYRTLSHNGGMPGVATALKLVPDKDIAVVVLANNESTITDDLPDDIIAALLPDYGARLAKARKAQPTDASSSTSPKKFMPPPPLIGSWKGTVRTWGGTLPMKLVMHADGRGRAVLASQPEDSLKETSFADGTLTASFVGTIPTEDVRRHPPQEIFIRLRMRADSLDGAIIAVAVTPRLHYILPSWVALIKAPSEPSTQTPKH